MDCLRSFTLRINQVANASGPQVQSWGTAGNYNWLCSFSPGGNISTFNLTGFKNTDIYGVSVVGGVMGNATSPNAKVLVNDWFFRIGINGQTPLVSGEKDTVTDGWSLFTTSPNANFMALSKNTNTVMLSNPYKSVTSISFLVLKCSGIAGEFLNLVALDYDLSFTFYYKYEGE